MKLQPLFIVFSTGKGQICAHIHSLGERPYGHVVEETGATGGGGLGHATARQGSLYWKPTLV